MMILTKKRIAKKKTHKIKTKTKATAARMKRNRVSKSRDADLGLIQLADASPHTPSLKMTQDSDISDLVTESRVSFDQPVREITAVDTQPYDLHLVDPEPQRTDPSDLTSCLHRVQDLLDQAQQERQRLIAQDVRDETAMMERLFRLIHTYLHTRPI